MVCSSFQWMGGAPNGLGGLYKTTNRGTSWTKLTGSQFDRVTSITFDPLNTNQAYLTTETQGLWFSSNMNSVTPTWTLVNSYPFRQPERVFFNPYNQSEVWVTSFGNGMKVGTSGPLGIKESALEENPVKVFPNPFNEKITFTYPNNNKRISKVNIYDPTGRLLISKQDQNNYINTSTLDAGIYFLEFIFNDNTKGHKKIIK